MSWKDFIDVWSNISICKKFAESWEGVRFFGEWDEKTSGGTPTSNDPKLFDAYLKNPQYILNIEEKTQIYINLGQEDGRMKSKGELRFPYEGMQYYMSICVFKLD